MREIGKMKSSVICDGEDEEEAMKAMMDAVESGLGE